MILFVGPCGLQSLAPPFVLRRQVGCLKEARLCRVSWVGYPAWFGVWFAEGKDRKLCWVCQLNRHVVVLRSLVETYQLRRTSQPIAERNHQMNWKECRIDMCVMYVSIWCGVLDGRTCNNAFHHWAFVLNENGCILDTSWHWFENCYAMLRLP